MSEEESFWKMKKEGDLKFIKEEVLQFPVLMKPYQK